jgi:hypothetical protein
MSREEIDSGCHHQETKSQSESPDTTKITSDDGDDLIPLVSQGPNIFYGYGDGLLELLEYGENPSQYWLKSMIMDQYKASEDYDGDGIACVGIGCDSKNLQTPEAELLSTHFSGLSADWWYEVTLQRQKPEGMALQVKLESSHFDQEGYIWGGKDLGEWWISDIQVSEGESLKAMETIHPMMS